MLRLIARRLLASVLVIVAASFVVFTLVAASGDPLASLRAKPTANKANIELLTAKLHLDRPIPVRWAIWAKGLLHGDMGRSYHDRPVSEKLARAFPVTLSLVLSALVLALVMTVLLGSISAARAYSLFDHAGTVVAFVFLALPSFWLAGILRDLALRANARLGATVLFVAGDRTPAFAGSALATVADRVGHLALPALTLALVVTADWSRFFRASMIDALGSDYVRTARAKGLSELRVVGHHALRNAAVPLTTLVSLTSAQLIGGAVVIEAVFGWPGSGGVLIHSLGERDANMVSGWLLIAALAVVTINLMADVAYGVLDPRTRSD